MHKNFVSSFKVNLGNTPQRRDFERLRHLSQEQAAKSLGVSLSTFKRKLREFDPRIKWSTKAERQELKKRVEQLGGTLEDHLDAVIESSATTTTTTTISAQPKKRKSSSDDDSFSPPTSFDQISPEQQMQQMMQNVAAFPPSFMGATDIPSNSSLLDTVTMQLQQQQQHRELEEQLQLQQQLQQVAQQNLFLQQQKQQLQQNSLPPENNTTSPPQNNIFGSNQLQQAAFKLNSSSPPTQQQQFVQAMSSMSNVPSTNAFPPQQNNNILALLPPQVTQEIHSLKTSNFTLQQMLSNISSDNQRLAGLLNESENIIRELMSMKMQTPIPTIPRYMGDMKNLIGPWSAMAHEDTCAMFISDENTFIISTNEKFHEVLKYTRQEVMHGMRIPRMLMKNVHDENFYIATIKRLYYSGLQTVRGNHTYKGKDGVFNVFDHVVHIETDQRTGSKYAWHELHLLHKSDGNPSNQVKPIKFSPDFEFDSSKGKRPALQKLDGSISDTDFSVEEHFVYSSVNQLVDQLEKKRETERMKQLGIRSEFTAKATNLRIELEDLSGQSTLANEGLVLTDRSPKNSIMLENAQAINGISTPTTGLSAAPQHDYPTTTTTTTTTRNSHPPPISTQQNADPQAPELFNDYLEGFSPYFGPTVTTPRSPTFAFELDNQGDNANGASTDRPRKRQKTKDDFNL